MNKEEKDKELEDLVEKVTSGFKRVSDKEDDLSNLLLKGHLFVENFLGELLAALDLNKDESIHRLYFSQKLRKISEYRRQNKEKPIGKNLSRVLPALYALNDLRNNLAHNYNFKLEEQDIDKVGNNLGSEYILRKYSTGHKNLKQNLLFCINKIINEIGLNIYLKVCELRGDFKDKQ